MRTSGKDDAQTDGRTESSLWQARFARYFPRVFAYVSSYLRGPAAREVVTETFRRALSFPDPLTEAEFRVVLFGVARRLCHGHPAHENDGLSECERDVVSLVFDAELDRDEIGALLGIKEDLVGSALLRGLKKLRLGAAPSFPSAA